MPMRRRVISRRGFLRSSASGAALGALAAGCMGGSAPADPDRPPNLLFVFSDQHRGMDLGCAGNREVRSPTFDRLGAEGTRFDRAYSNTPVCTPTRGTILTGLYAHQHGAVVNDVPLPADQTSIADLLKAAGYRTGYIGKWHLDGVPRNRFTPPGPRRQGFDFWAAWNCSHAYFRARVFRDKPEPVSLKGYEPVAQTDLALEFLRRPDPRPWCLFLSWGPPHAPYHQVPETYKAMYDASAVSLRPNVRPEPPKPFRRLGGGQWRADLAGYYAHITAIDVQMKRLLDALDASGAAADTIVVYSSDHGDMLGSHGMSKKEQPWEEAIRIPLIVRWPGRIPAGRVTRALASTVDYVPTLLALMGRKASFPMAGTDLSDVMLGRSEQGAEDVLLTVPIVVDQGQAQNVREWRGLRTDRYTFARWWDGDGWILYDNEADPCQLENLIDSPEHQAVRHRLEARLRRRLAEVGDPCVSWQETIRHLGLVDLWNRRERFMHRKNPRLIKDA